MSRNRLGVPATLILALTAASCGGGGSNDGASETTKATGTTQEAGSFSEEEAKAAAKTVQLTINDFPTGWVKEAAQPNNGTFGANLPAECQFFGDEENVPGTVTTVESDEFVSPDKERVSSNSTVYEKAEAGANAFAAIRQFFDDCREPLRNAFTDLFRDALRNEVNTRNSSLQLELTQFGLNLMPFPQYGDESLAFRMNGKIESPEISLDFTIDAIGTRLENVDAGLTYVSYGSIPSAESEKGLMLKLEQRAREAAASLK